MLTTEEFIAAAKAGTLNPRTRVVVDNDCVDAYIDPETEDGDSEPICRFDGEGPEGALVAILQGFGINAGPGLMNVINTLPADETGAVDFAALRRLHGIRDDDPEAARLTGEALLKEAQQFARINPHAVVSQEQAEAEVREFLATLVADTTEPPVDGMYPILVPPPKDQQH